MINFKLIEFDKVVPVGQEPNRYLSWYWLTRGEVWLRFGDITLYEYTKESLEHFGKKNTPYNDYYLIQFINDFTDLFSKIGQSIPTSIYEMTKDLKPFFNKSQKWLEIYDTDENEFTDSYNDNYDKIYSWRNERTFDSIHLIGGPSFSFFRNQEKIRIVWETDYNLENGISLWTAKSGTFEMNFNDFVNEIKKFGELFFFEMDKQIQLTMEKEWGNIKVEKSKIIDEQKNRKLEFDKNIELLLQNEPQILKWDELNGLMERMDKELKK